jgi:hypothetical protein
MIILNVCKYQTTRHNIPEDLRILKDSGEL